MKLTPFGTGLLSLALLALFALSAPAGAQSTSPGGGYDRLGINLTDVVDFSSEWVFVDVFNHARPWISQDQGFIGFGPFDNMQPIATTPEGWPLLAPGQAVATLMLNGIDGNYPGGTYVVEYDGTGELLFGNDASIASQTPGRIELNVNPGNGGIYFKLNASDNSDPVRNINVVMPGFEDTFEDQVFHPLFIERLDHYGVVRFMNWGRINNSEISSWSDRPTPDLYSQATDGGVSLEYMIELLNRTGKSGWFCVPHLADDNYVTQMATLLRDNLRPDVQVYLEYSNEVWNNIYTQYDYAFTNGIIEGLAPGAGNEWQATNYWYSKRAVQMFNIFDNVFGAQSGRVTSVMGGFAAFSDGPTKWALEFQNAGNQVDAVAIAPYFASDFGFPSEAPTTLLKTVQEVLDCADISITAETLSNMTSNLALANQYNIPLLASEGGQRMAAEGPFQSNPTLNALFAGANRDPRMYDLYLKYLDQWETVTGQSLMMAYTSTREYSQFGYYGTLEYQDQPVADAPKYRALQDWSNARTGVTPYGEGCGLVDIYANGLPEIGNANFSVNLENGVPGQVTIFWFGGSNTTWQFGALPFDLSTSFAPGCTLLASPKTFFFQANNSEGTATQVLPIPNDASLVGKHVYLQAASANPAANILGFEFTQGLDALLQ